MGKTRTSVTTLTLVLSAKGARDVVSLVDDQRHAVRGEQLVLVCEE